MWALTNQQLECVMAIAILRPVKLCGVCGLEKSENGRCKPCHNARNSAWRKANPEKQKAAVSAWTANNLERRRQTNREWADANADQLKAYFSDRYKSDRERLLKLNADWQRSNPEKVRAKSRSYEQRHREERLARNKTPEAKAMKAMWGQKYPEKARAKVAAYRASKMQATPSWADRFAIQAVYDQAVKLTAETGIPHHVDHAVPLNGKTVCGLHVEFNLQILSASENCKKRNAYWPDMP